MITITKAMEERLAPLDIILRTDANPINRWNAFRFKYDLLCTVPSTEDIELMLADACPVHEPHVIAVYLPVERIMYFQSAGMEQNEFRMWFTKKPRDAFVFDRQTQADSYETIIDLCEHYSELRFTRIKADHG